MLKILIAPTAFKGTLSPTKVAEAIEAGVNNSGIDCQIELAPVADGGDGTLECLHFALGGKFEYVSCHGPTGILHTASWLQLPECAVVELATCCGLAQMAELELQPLKASTQGLGEVIADCLDKYSGNIVVTLGGSASTDGGSGALKSLGARFLNEDGEEIMLGGGALSSLASIDLSSLKRNIQPLKIAVDVNNPLLGPNGAGSFAPQKGAGRHEVEILESGLQKFAHLMEAKAKTRARDMPGTGAAGGTAFGLLLGLKAQLVSGFYWLAELLNLEEKIQWADIVISAEGCLDEQSLQGKATGELGRLCKRYGKNLIVIAAHVDPACRLKDAGVTQVSALAVDKNLVGSLDISSAVSALVKNYKI